MAIETIEVWNSETGPRQADVSEFQGEIHPSIHVDGSATVLDDIPMNGHKLTGLADGTDGQDAVTVAQLEDTTSGFVTESQMDSAIEAAIEAIPPPSASSAITTSKADIDLTTTDSLIIDVRPDTPAGPNRWKLMEITLRLKEAVSGVGASSAVSIGTLSGGQQIVLNQTILSTANEGDIIGGFALPSLGGGMSQVTGFEAIYPASQAIYANVTAAGAPATGILTAYFLWMVLS